MWDEQERFARAFLKWSAWSLAGLGLVLAALGVAARDPEVTRVYVLILGLLAAAILIYAGAVGSVA